MLQLKDDGNTIALMECLRETNKTMWMEPVYYKGRVRFMVSSIDDKAEMYTDHYPLDTWKEYDGMRRLHVGGLSFLLHINGKFYFATLETMLP